MAPSRKKGGGKAAAAASARREWKVGDLVLAKVKGFPAWPAAVSEPEKWSYSVDRKKVFVLFFGTQQIAFCNPADVEPFTEEKKQSLLTKRHAKGSDFMRAIKEITESYEKQKQQDQVYDPKSAEETTIGSSGITEELPQGCEDLNGAKLDTQIKSNSSQGRDEATLLSEAASAAEQMLALRHNSRPCNGIFDSTAAKDLCEIATHASSRRNTRGLSQKCDPQKPILLRQCSNGGQSVGDIDNGGIRTRKRTRRSGHSESEDVVISALNPHGSDEENASEIATVESDNSSRNEGIGGVDSGSKVEHSDAVREDCEGDYELHKGLDFQINTMVKRKKRKATRKRETSDLIDPPAVVEAKESLETKACDNSRRSQSSHERLNERPCEGNGDEHLPLVKRARVRMSRAYYADEQVNASSQFEERSSEDTLISAAVQTSPLVNHEIEMVSGHDTNAAGEFKSFEMSAKLSGDMADVVPSHMEKPSHRMSPSRACSQTVGDKKLAMEFHLNELSMASDDEITQAQSNRLSSSAEGEVCVPEVDQGCSEESQTRNCLNSQSDPSNVQCSHQSERNKTPSDSDTVDTSASEARGLCPCLDVTASGVPSQSPHEHRSQDNDSGDHALVTVRDVNERCEKIDHHMAQVVLSQSVEHSPLFCSVVNTQETENKQGTENTLVKEKERSLGVELNRDNQAHMIQNSAVSATKPDMVVKEASPHYETVRSNSGDAVEKREPEKSVEAVEQREQAQATNSVSVSQNLSHDKMSLSPADVADSPARGILQSSSVCHISTAENANIIQNNINCSTSLRLGEKNFMCETVKEEGKVETGVTQPKNSDVQSTIESFESALGSLVRTKETIGRATRLAMDLAKFGVSTKAMEILAHTLESESNLQRRVDLFFLVDSIAQCSKGLNGEAGGVYLSSIQVMLPRLLAAAVPAGATTQENRRQCVKVLRVWLERRILTESIVRHHIRELESHSNAPACLYSRRSARTERALDDPVRDMEGMLVDEYGSNSTLQLSGFCMPAMLKVEDEGSDSDGPDFEDVTPEHESRILEEHVTPSNTERHTRILEDVDGELEMEDVSPPWETGSSAINNQAYHTESANNQSSGTSHHNATSTSPPQSLPRLPAPPSQNAQCAMSDSYSNGFDCGGYRGMHGDHQAGPPMHYRSPESSYSSRVSMSKSMSHGEDSYFQHRPYPSSHPPPPPPHHYSYVEPDQHIKSRRDGPSYPQRSHYRPDFDERNYRDSHERMRPAPYENRDNWRYHPPSSYGPRYHERHRGPYQSNSYNDPERESGRYQNHRWSRSPPRAYNGRHSFHYKPHLEGPVPVGMRDPGTWHQR